MSITGLGISGVASITVICYLVCQAVKATTLNNKWLPVIAGASGMLLGVAGLYLMPNFPASDIITAAAIGIVSGLAATGIHQIYKQMTK